jgi:hypothetical protein
MKKIIFSIAVFAIALPSIAANVGVSINVGQPGFYGRINIGDFPQPSVVYTEPVIIQPAQRYMGSPIYLRVPSRHRQNWSSYCRSYNACGQQVYFVQDGWYNNVYAPRYRTEHRYYSSDRSDYEDRRGNNDQHGHGHHDKHDKHGRGHDRD